MTAFSHPVEPNPDPTNHEQVAPDDPAREPARREPYAVIEPTKPWYDIDLRGVWRHRDLVYFLVRRDLKSRYRQTFLGALWAVIQPLGPMIVYTLVFNRIIGVATDVPYPVFVYSGLLPWTYFAGAAAASGASLDKNAGIIRKVYFPRLVLPAASVVTGLVDLAISSLLLFVLMAVLHVPISWTVVLAIPLMLALGLLAFSIGTIMASLSVVYRDVRHAFPFVLQLWMFLTPVIYPARVVPENLKWITRANPVAPLIEATRAALLGTPVHWDSLGIALAIVAALALAACILFVRMERYLADYA